jgi:putative spermidine/putrescine transport system substrate-binding protein
MKRLSRRALLRSVPVLSGAALAACAVPPPANRPAAPAAPSATTAPASGAPASGAPASGAPASNASAASGSKKVVNLYSDGDTNISDWFSNIIKPAFDAASAGHILNFVNVRGVGDGTKAIAERALAALKTNSDPQAEAFDYDALGNPELIKEGLWFQFDPVDAKVPNAKSLNPAGITSTHDIPYRGSQVLIAYDSAKVAEADVPKTFAALIEWVKKNPGQFTYCRPDKGGSGGNFVTRAIYEVTGKDPSKFKPGDPDPALLAEYDKAWELLRSIHDFTFEKGSYPAGNQPALQLLANGSISMVSAWSDQAIQALEKGVLPETVKLVQFEDLPMPGGYAHLSVPKNAANLDGALEFVNFMLSSEMQVSVIKSIGGFPAVSWNTLPIELQQQFNSVITANVPSWPGGKWGAERNKGWYEKVATNIKPE